MRSKHDPDDRNFGDLAGRAQTPRTALARVPDAPARPTRRSLPPACVARVSSLWVARATGEPCPLVVPPPEAAQRARRLRISAAREASPAASASASARSEASRASAGRLAAA